MSSSNRPSNKSSRKGSSKSSDKVLKEIAALRKEVKKLRKENKKLDAHIDAIYHDNNNTAQQIMDMFSTMDGQGDEIILIKKTMKEKLNINWRRVEEE